MAACLVTHPLDLAKVRLQTASKPGQSLFSMIYQIITKEGFFKIYSGLTASLLRQATYSTTRFGVYEFLKETYIEKQTIISLALQFYCQFLWFPVHWVV